MDQGDAELGMVPQFLDRAVSGRREGDVMFNRMMFFAFLLFSLSAPAIANDPGDPDCDYQCRSEIGCVNKQTCMCECFHSFCVLDPRNSKTGCNRTRTNCLNNVDNICFSEPRLTTDPTSPYISKLELLLLQQNRLLVEILNRCAQADPASTAEQP